MRVYFAPCGIGLGHVGRCVPIAKRLKERGVDVVFSTYCDGAQYVELEGFRTFKAPPIGFQVKPDGTVDFKQTVVNPGLFLTTFILIKQVNAELKAIRGFKPDVVFSDSRVSPLLVAKALKIPSVCMLNQFHVIIPRKRRFLRLAKLADFATLALIGEAWVSTEAVLVPDFPKPYTVCVGNLNIPKRYEKNVKLIGPILPVRPEELPHKDKVRRRLKLPNDKTVIFVPISGPAKERAFLTRKLRKVLLKLPRHYEVVLSLGQPSAYNNPVRCGQLTVFNWIPNRFEYLKACDLVISRAGHGTVTQSMCYGKPMILVPTPSHTEQLNNAKRAEALGVAKVIEQEALSTETLMDDIQQILEGGAVDRLKGMQRELLKYDGLENAVKTIMEAGGEAGTSF